MMPITTAPAAHLLRAGYRQGPPPHLTTDAIAIDREVCQGATCEDCGCHGLRYEPFHHDGHGSYVALCVCPRCHAATEF